jgi:hypothetical protein
VVIFKAVFAAFQFKTHFISLEDHSSSDCNENQNFYSVMSKCKNVNIGANIIKYIVRAKEDMSTLHFNSVLQICKKSTTRIK